jgi:hypothetical protein
MKEIALTQGKVAIVDDEDFEALCVHKWHANRDECRTYAARTIRRPENKWVTEQMHVIVLARKLGRPIAERMQCDHDNGDGLDNRRENLLEVTKAQNIRNRHHRPENTSSRFLGVSWHKREGKWQARIMIDGTNLHLGYHDTELAAALAREACIKLHPELHAKSNFRKSTTTTQEDDHDQSTDHLP